MKGAWLVYNSQIWPVLLKDNYSHISAGVSWNFNDSNYNQCRVFVWCPELVYFSHAGLGVPKLIG